MTTLLHATTVPVTLGFFRGQLEYMAARELELHVISSPGPELDDMGRRGLACVRAIPMQRRFTPLRDLVAVARLRAAMAAIRPTIVHAHTPKAGLLGMVAAAASGVPVRIYHLRGLPLSTARGPLRVLLRWTERLACRLAHRVLCVSPSLRDAALAERLCSPDKLAVLGAGSSNGVDALGRFHPGANPERGARTREELRIPADAPVIGFVGRLVRDKGIVELARAWDILRVAHPRARLLLIGPLEERDAVPQETLATLRGDDRVLLIGTVRDVVAFYAAMDVLALPSHREGFPNVVLEAAAMEVPAVTTTATGCIDAVESGVTGLLVEPGDAAGLAAALTRYLGDPELRRRHGRAGRDRCLREFPPERIWEALLMEYQTLLRARLEGGRRLATAAESRA